MKTDFDRVRQCFSDAVAAHNLAESMLKGRSIRIVSDYNGQPYGSSKPSLCGQECVVEQVNFDMQWGISLKLKNHSLYIKLDEVELV